MNWNSYFIEMAMLVAKKSKDPSTKVGCVIVGPDNEIRSTGFNGFPRGVQEVGLQGRHIPTVISKKPGRVRCVDCDARPEVTQEDFDKYLFTKEYLKVHPHFSEGEVRLLDDRWSRPEKYEFIEHAERNAVYNAARIGTPLRGCVAYLNWEPTPCIECAKAFIQAGIVKVVGPDIPFSSTSDHDWKFEISCIMLEEAGVECVSVSGWKED